MGTSVKLRNKVTGKEIKLKGQPKPKFNAGWRTAQKKGGKNA